MTKLPVNEQLSILIKNLVLQHFKKLSEDIADSLWLMETTSFTNNSADLGSHELQKNTTMSFEDIDKLAEELDIILDSHKLSIIDESHNVINNLMKTDS